METNRRGFLTFLSAAVAALVVPLTKRPDVPPKPKPPAPLPPVEESAYEPIQTGCWTQKCDDLEHRNRIGEVDYIIPHNHREEYEGPIELMNLGGMYDGPIVINSKTVEQGYGKIKRVTIRATRYPKVI